MSHLRYRQNLLAALCLRQVNLYYHLDMRSPPLAHIHFLHTLSVRLSSSVSESMCCLHISPLWVRMRKEEGPEWSTISPSSQRIPRWKLCTHTFWPLVVSVARTMDSKEP